MCWFKTFRNDVVQSLISKQETGLGYTTPYALRLKLNKFNVRIGDGSSLQDIKYEGVELNKWYFFAGTWDGTNIRLYVDGELKIVDSQDLTPYINTVPLKIAAEGPSSSLPFNGIIDEVRIYNRALTPKEIQIHYAFTKYIKPHFIIMRRKL